MADVNSKGTNVNIKAHILDEKRMREIGFTDYAKDQWFFCRGLGNEISFNVTIPKDGSDIEIITLDDNFCQPYDYQNMLKGNPNFKPAIRVRDKVEECMEYLQECGVLSGHEKGDYI